MSEEIPKISKEVFKDLDLLGPRDLLGNIRYWSDGRQVQEITTHTLDPKNFPQNFRPPSLDAKPLTSKLLELLRNQNFSQTITRSFTYGANPITNYRNQIASGASGLTATWWALRGTAGYYFSALTATLNPAGKVLAAGAFGFVAGVGLDRAQEALFGQSYTAAGVKAFLEMPSIWGSAEAAPKQLVDAWDEYFSWTNYPDQAMAWLKRNLG